MQLLRRFLPISCILFFLFTMTPPLCAQSSDVSGSLYLISMLIVLGALLVIGAVAMLSNYFVQFEADKAGIQLGSDQKAKGKSTIRSFFRGSDPSYVGDATVTYLDQGFDIQLNGAASELDVKHVKRYAVSPPDYRGISPIPKVVVAVGDQVQAGQVLFYDKNDLDVKYVAPVSGEVVEIRRGSKRAITEVIILADRDLQYIQHEPPSISQAGRQEIIDYLVATGGWTLINQRPYDLLPDQQIVPKNIFISTFDTAPLALDQGLAVDGRTEAFQKGIDTLARLTDGAVHLGLDAQGDQAPHEAFTQATNCQKHWFSGKHPSGNVGIQIHHIHPIAKGDKVWTLTVQDVCTLGDLMYKGIYDARRKVAITGSRVARPAIIETYMGASIDELLLDQLSGDKFRIIDGDVLSGLQAGVDDFLHARSDQITVINEGDDYELFGWLLPIKPRPSISRTFPSFLMPSLKYDGETNTHGEKRAFVMTGQYESVLPMDLYPQHIMKAILANDYERMEGLGLQELSEEDVALCEFVCTSKQPLQKILREGLDMMKDQE